MKILDKPTANFNARADGISVRYIIMHYTNTRSAAEAEDYFFSRITGAPPVSTHYMIDTDGAITRYVADENRAWHAGVSHWRGQTDMNSASIGIEMVNGGDRYGYTPFTDAQMGALAALCRDLMARHKIAPENVIGHSDIAPARKIDPDVLFNWRALAAQGIGVWPEPAADEEAQAPALLADKQRLKAALVAYGYDPEPDLPDVLRAFQRHFEPEAFAQGQDGTATATTAKRLLALLRSQGLQFSA